jgi:hypothetical protein
MLARRHLAFQQASSSPALPGVVAGRRTCQLIRQRTTRARWRAARRHVTMVGVAAAKTGALQVPAVRDPND